MPQKIEIPREARKALQKLLKLEIDWLKGRDPKRQFDKMQGARYAYTQCWKWLQKNL